MSKIYRLMKNIIIKKNVIRKYGIEKLICEYKII